MQNLSLLHRFCGLTCCLFFFLTALTPALAQTIRYVKPTATGTGTGTSWANASGDLQAMINASAVNDQVWVASGTYRPANVRTASFTIKTGVAVYGNFWGGETALTQRAPITYAFPSNSILSGDIGVSGNVTDNSYHVVLFSQGGNNTRLDGFVITEGNANGGGDNDYGAGIFNRGTGTGAAGTGSSNPGIANCFITNNRSAFSGAGIYNGGRFGGSASPSVQNCVFTNNTTQYGGALFNDGLGSLGSASPILTNCMFWNNTASQRGGAMYNDGAGGGQSFPLLRSCTLAGNTATNGGAEVFNSGTGAVLYLQNSVLWNPATDAVPSSHTVAALYSLFSPNITTHSGPGQGAYTGTGIVKPATSPFANLAGGNLQLGCNSPGTNAGDPGITNTNMPGPELNGNARVEAGRVDMGAFEYQSVFLAQLGAGTIGGPALVPAPQEFINTLTSQTNASANASPFTIRWQQSDNNGSSWTDIPNANAQSIALPTLSTDGLSAKNYQFRRIITNLCSVTATTPTLAVRAMRTDGIIRGRVVSGDGVTPVANVTITAVRNTTGLAGSPGSMTYTGVTDSNGDYTIGNVYYGFPQETIPAAISASAFTLTPRFSNHVFSPASLSFVMNQFNNPSTGRNFTDLTTFGISGSISQSCPDCITGFSGQTPLIGVVSCPIDTVQVRADGIGFTRVTQTGLLNGNYGQYALVVNNPGTYTLTASYRNLNFTPSPQVLNVNADVYNLTFSSPTSRTLTGRLMAGCNEPIGQAVLEFNDVLPNGRPSCFSKQVTTNASGFYTITLPARRYVVRVVSFTPMGTNPVNATDVRNFFDTMPANLRTTDLTSVTTTAQLNLVYQRPPTLVIGGLSSPACTTAYALMTQNTPVSLSVAVFQGPASFNCPVTSGTVLITTDVVTGSSENRSLSIVNGVSSFTMLPGTPNIIAPFYRSLNVQFTDAFGQGAPSLNRNVVVTGVRAGTATFETVSPQIPLLVLHDPPGDNSFSSWSQSTTQERAIRFYSAMNTTTQAWGEVKLGTKFQSGVGVTVETEVWGTLSAGVSVGARNSSSNEKIVTVSTESSIATSSAPGVVGDDGDVFMGGAMNIRYAISTVIGFNPTSCSVGSSQQLIMVPLDVRTQYYYTAGTIRSAVIPNLKTLRDLATDPVQRNRFANQVRVWEQVLANNEANKAAAQFVINKTFGGNVVVSETSTRSVSRANTIEFGLEIDNNVAAALGFETAGSGASGGVSVNFKVETGDSEVNTDIRTTTTGYTLIDDDANDRISVDVLTDPVYGTPVFRTLGGETSCPPEPETVPRDDVQFSAPVTVQSNVPANTEAQFTLRMGNISQVSTDNNRTFRLSFEAGSNPDGALISVNGSPYISPLQYTLIRLAPETQVTVRVAKSATSTVFAYENLTFKLTDACGGDLEKTVSLSVFFQSPCSAVSLVTPEPGWITTLNDNNQMPIQIGGYTWANIGNVALEYSPAGSSSWFTAFTLPQNGLANSANGTITTWTNSGLADGDYTLRLKLTCPLGNGATGTVYSARVPGRIDRTRPALFGTPQPANDVFVLGSSIGATYDEPLDCAQTRTGSTSATVARTSNGQTVPVSIGCANNQIILVPTVSLSALTGEIVSVTLAGVADLAGNLRTTPDVWRFQIGSSTAATGNDVVSLALSGSPLAEDGAGMARVVFSVPQSVAYNRFINFGVAGIATFPTDYTISYASSVAQPLSATLDGPGGSIMIPSGATSATLLIDPTPDSRFESDETVIITLLSGGNYRVGSPASVTALILNDDPVSNIITSIRTGNWEDANTWDLARVPVATDDVVLDPNHTVSLTGIGNAKKIIKRSNSRLRLQATSTRLRLGF